MHNTHIHLRSPSGWHVSLLICLYNSGVTTGQLHIVTWCTPTRERTRKKNEEKKATHWELLFLNFLRPSPPCALSSWPSHLSQALQLQLSHSVCGCNYSCPSLRLSLNNGISWRPRSRYNSLSKFDFSSHLHSINSAICLILYLNCSSGCQDSVCLGKGRGTVLEKLHWWMTGEIGRDVRVVGGKKTPNQQKRRGRNFTAASFIFFIVVFLFWHRGNCWVEKVKGFLCYCCFFSLSVPLNWILLFSSSLFPEWRGGYSVSPRSLLVTVPPLLSHNPFLCFFFFFLLLFSLVVGIDQVTRQRQGSQFYLSFFKIPFTC